MIKKISIVLASILFLIPQNNKAQNIDIDLLKNINAATGNGFWQFSSQTVYPLAIASPAITLLVGYGMNNKKLQRKGWNALGSLVLNTAITQGMKYAIDRARPYIDYPNLITPASLDKDGSFPSGHTSTAFNTAAAITFISKKWYVVIPAYTWAASVAYSRLRLGEHYPTDVLIGAGVGLGSAYIGKWISNKIFKIK
jgi:undecaprenyl-diphosphatase